MHPALLRPDDSPGKIKRYIWRDGKQYFSLVELAGRRRCTRQAVWKWAQRNPHLVAVADGHKYGRDL